MIPAIPDHPTQTDIDRAREDLENANFKLGKARARSITSTAQASLDAQECQDCVDRAAAAENRFVQITDRFINRARTPVAAASGHAATQAADSEFFKALHAELDGKDREFVLGRVSEIDRKRLASMVAYGSPLKDQVEILLAFLDGRGDGLRDPNCGQPKAGANGLEHADETGAAG